MIESGKKDVLKDESIQIVNAGANVAKNPEQDPRLSNWTGVDKLNKNKEKRSKKKKSTQFPKLAHQGQNVTLAEITLSQPRNDQYSATSP